MPARAARRAATTTKQPVVEGFDGAMVSVRVPGAAGGGGTKAAAAGGDGDGNSEGEEATVTLNVCNMASFDFLGLRNAPEVKDAATGALRKCVRARAARARGAPRG